MADSTEQMREARKVLAAPAAEQDAGYTIEQIADACVQAEISDGHFESLRIALAALTAPAAEPEQSTRLRGGVPTEAQIVAAARTLNKLSANSCNVDEADQWALYGNTFRAEAKAALTSALTAAPQAPAQQATPDALLEQIDDAALGGICQATSSGKHAFLVDIRKLVAGAQAPALDAGVVRDAWRLLETGDRIESADEVLHDDCVTWGSLVGWEVGATYNTTLFMPIRRKVLAAMSAQGGAA